MLLTRFLTALAVLLISSTCVANAPRIEILKHQFSDGRSAPAEIYISGEMTQALSGEFLALLRQHSVTTGTVYFDSDGGDVMTSMELGGIIRKAGFNTSVGKMGAGYGQAGVGKCQSSCVLSFLGGYFRFAPPGSVFGIHRFYKQTSGQLDLDVGQVLSAAITSYLIRMGADPALFERMVQVGRGRMQQLALDEAAALNVVNNGVLPATWTIEGKGGKVYLRGEQEAWIGTGKILIHCGRVGVMELSALYDAGVNTPMIAKSARNYSVRIDKQFVSLNAQDMISPLGIQNGYLVATFRVSPPLAQTLSTANQIGFGFHPDSTTTFYGFLVNASTDRETIQSFIAHCRDL
ncbi:hypothetical protein QAO71_17920 (plasmid) [Halopseudomonas sp. SMJS2]|uniref:COG3904 family protein n=1 Tax=Halopseudomonas sp. SMJS2 TaxID=3041098 RepID=UPI002452DAC4|nr:hypothetical protein [Halopseudomonas sp. SMJS2]WGK63420.1 hypothetical protein QAO71_17920 [Halopseudomonas sp. SMJS2]